MYRNYSIVAVAYQVEELQHSSSCLSGRVTKVIAVARRVRGTTNSSSYLSGKVTKAVAVTCQVEELRIVAVACQVSRNYSIVAVAYQVVELQKK